MKILPVGVVLFHAEG